MTVIHIRNDKYTTYYLLNLWQYFCVIHKSIKAFREITEVTFAMVGSDDVIYVPLSQMFYESDHEEKKPTQVWTLLPLQNR